MKNYKIDFLEKTISAIGLGTMVFHPDTKTRDFSILNAYVENGGTYIDIAEVYGAVEEHGYSEMVIGDWLEENPNMREKIVLTTKGLIPGYCAPLHPGGAKINPESIHKAIDGSLKRLKADYLDIWMFHRDDPSLAVGPLVDALDEEVKMGRIKSYGGSNWSTSRIEEAISYALKNNKTPMTSASPNFSLAFANEPFWPDTVITSKADLAWYQQKNFLLVAWSALGRGFFAKADPGDLSDQDLVRVFYSDDNFTRKKRVAEFAEYKNISIYEVALAYVIGQNFPVVALNGAETPEQITNSMQSAKLDLSLDEKNWLDLTTNNKPF
jgi:aryl-alcohol dehydrogenase-like predicted oxidoreductase